MSPGMKIFESIGLIYDTYWYLSFMILVSGMAAKSGNRFQSNGSYPDNQESNEHARIISYTVLF